MSRAWELIEVDEPNIIADQFDYDMVPKIKFDGRMYEPIDGKLVEFDPQEAVQRELVITDTTFRDGQQARPPYTIDQIVHIYDLLAKLGGPQGVIRQTEFFLYTKNDRDALDRCRALGHSYPEITGWIRADKGDFRLVKEAGLAETGMLTSSSDYHIFYKQKMDRKKAMEHYLEVVDAALETGVRPRCHLEDVTRADWKGFVFPFCAELVKRAEQVSDELKPKVRLCDTMGFGVTYPGAMPPRSIPKLVYYMTQEVGIPPERLEWHGHNDFHKVHINAATPWLYGCNAANATLLGFGERTGNPPLEGAIIEYIALKGDFNGIDTRVITEMADYFRKEIGAQIAPNYPFVGADFNKTRAGIHAGGLRRHEAIYNIFDTTKLLGRAPGIAVTDKSGIDGIALWINTHFNLAEGEKLRTIDVTKIGRWVMDQYEVNGRLTAISDDELVEQVKVNMPEFYEKHKDAVR